MISDPRRLVTEHLGLFKLEWIGHPESLRSRAQEHGLKDVFTLELSAWCAELHLQIEELAAAMGLDLILMGGNAAALRMEVSAQRGSRDNDYLTSATPGEVAALMESLRSRFSELPEPLFTYRQIGPPEENRLPLLSYMVTVPALLAPNAPEGTIAVKLEFHLSAPESMPENELVEGTFLSTGEPLRARTPKRPHQFVLKAMTLLAPPVGVEDTREDVIPRQIYDLDVLSRQISDDHDWIALGDYASERYEFECEQHDAQPIPGDPWKGFADRLTEWSSCENKASRYWRAINAFQSGQLARSSAINSHAWAARIHRMRLLGRCLDLGSDGRRRWRKALHLETSLPSVSGKAMKEQRRTLASVIEVNPKQIVTPQLDFWRYLADAAELEADMNTLDVAFSR